MGKKKANREGKRRLAPTVQGGEKQDKKSSISLKSKKNLKTRKKS